MRACHHLAANHLIGVTLLSALPIARRSCALGPSVTAGRVPQPDGARDRGIPIHAITEIHGL
jgi:hypothetical protein